jgi:GntR family transcriptional regulator
MEVNLNQKRGNGKRMQSRADSRSPRYFKIIQHFKREIGEGRLVEGDLLPPEKEIDRMFEVSRTTTRRALDELEVEGYLYRIQGKGTYVRVKPYIDHYPVLSSFSEDMRARARLPEHHTLSCSIELPVPQVCRELDITSEDKCLHLKRLLTIDNHPVGYAEIWIPFYLVEHHLDLFTPERLDPHSYYYLLEGPEIGLSVAKAIEVATGENADKNLSELLGVHHGTALLVIRHVGYLEDGRPCDSLKLVFGGSHYHYRTELIRPSGAGWAGRVFVVDEE